MAYLAGQIKKRQQGEVKIRFMAYLAGQKTKFELPRRVARSLLVRHTQLKFDNMQRSIKNGQALGIGHFLSCKCTMVVDNLQK
jgi:hypothetical protein